MDDPAVECLPGHAGAFIVGAALDETSVKGQVGVLRTELDTVGFTLKAALLAYTDADDLTCEPYALILQLARRNALVELPSRLLLAEPLAIGQFVLIALLEEAHIEDVE